MKILIVSNMYPTKDSPSFGVFVKKCFEQLSSNTEFVVKKSTLLPNKYKLLAYLNFYFYFFIHIIKFNPDVVYCHFVSHTGLLGVIAKYVFRKKLIINCHGTDIVNPLEKKNIIHKFNIVALNSCDLIVVPSSYFKNLICSIVGDYRSDRVLIYPSAGVSIPSIAPPLYDGSEVKHDIIQVGYVGNLIPEKGIKILIATLELIPFPIFLHVVGKGDKTVFEHIKNSKVTVKSYGELPQNELKIIYSTIDVLIFPTLLKESLGLAPIEAMAYYVPVIASDIGAVSEYVVTDETGFLINPSDVEQLKKAIIDFNGLSSEKLYFLKVGARKMAEQYSDVKASKLLIKSINSLKFKDKSKGNYFS